MPTIDDQIEENKLEHRGSHAEQMLKRKTAKEYIDRERDRIVRGEQIKINNAAREIYFGHKKDKLPFDEYIEKYQDEIKYAYQEALLDQGYPKYLLDETDDGWDEFAREYYNNV